MAVSSTVTEYRIFLSATVILFFWSHFHHSGFFLTENPGQQSTDLQLCHCREFGSKVLPVNLPMGNYIVVVQLVLNPDYHPRQEFASKVLLVNLPMGNYIVVMQLVAKSRLSSPAGICFQSLAYHHNSTFAILKACLLQLLSIYLTSIPSSFLFLC